MSNIVLKEIADSMPTIKKKMDELEDLIKAMQEVGQNTTTISSQLSQIRAQYKKYEYMLKKRGLLK